MDTQAEPSVFGLLARKVSGLSTSTTSRHSFWKRMRRQSDVENGSIELEEDGYSAAKTRLFAVMVNDDEKSARRALSDGNFEFQWYVRLLESHLPSLVSCIKLETTDRTEQEDNTWYKTKSMELLSLLARVLTSQNSAPSLDGIRLKLSNNPILQSAASVEAAYTIIFSMIGWLSMIYQPSQTFDHQEPRGEYSLAMELKDFRGNRLKSAVYRQRCISFKKDKTDKLPLNHVFSQFGKLMTGRTQQSGQVTSNLQVDVLREQLIVSYLKFQTLYQIAKIRIVWVDCLSLHLDFDEKSKRLKVFRFPSFCKLMYLCMVESSNGAQENSQLYLSSLFTWLYQPQTTGNRETVQSELNAQDYFREVLLTYRILFGQDKRSWKAWKSYCSTEVDAFDAKTADPLLPALCGRDCRNESTYSDIQAPELEQQYSAQEDYPFFGDRLVKVQLFVNKKNPGTWSTLWHDRRDILRFWTFWAVVIVGGASLILSLIQNLEGVLQIVYAVKQSNSPGAPPSAG